MGGCECSTACRQPCAPDQQGGHTETPHGHRRRIALENPTPALPNLFPPVSPHAIVKTPGPRTSNLPQATPHESICSLTASDAHMSHMRPQNEECSPSPCLHKGKTKRRKALGKSGQSPAAICSVDDQVAAGGTCLTSTSEENASTGSAGGSTTAGSRSGSSCPSRSPSPRLVPTTSEDEPEQSAATLICPSPAQVHVDARVAQLTNMVEVLSDQVQRLQLEVKSAGQSITAGPSSADFHCKALTVPCGSPATQTDTGADDHEEGEARSQPRLRRRPTPADGMLVDFADDVGTGGASCPLQRLRSPLAGAPGTPHHSRKRMLRGQSAAPP